jgi:hypothetical protein
VVLGIFFPFGYVVPRKIWQPWYTGCTHQLWQRDAERQLGCDVGQRVTAKENIRSVDQGCQMVSFQTKNPNLGKFWRALDWKMLIYFTAIWNILQIFGIFYDHLAHFFRFWYHAPRKHSSVEVDPEAKISFRQLVYLHSPRTRHCLR